MKWKEQLVWGSLSWAWGKHQTSAQGGQCRERLAGPVSVHFCIFPSELLLCSSGIAAKILVQCKQDNECCLLPAAVWVCLSQVHFQQGLSAGGLFSCSPALVSWSPAAIIDDLWIPGDNLVTTGASSVADVTPERSEKGSVKFLHFGQLSFLQTVLMALFLFFL